MIPSMHNYPIYIIERFWSKVAICAHGDTCQECCWPWKGCTIRGYGMFTVPKAYRVGKSKTERANRVCWRVVHGFIPEGLDVLHNCPSGDNPLCVNHWHLWVGTNKDNVHDAMKKGQRATGKRHPWHLSPPPPRQGENVPSAKLQSSDILPIFHAAIAGLSLKEIAKRKGVRFSTIGAILRRESWRHVAVPQAVLDALSQVLDRGIRRGDQHHASMLTTTQVLNIRAQAKAGISWDKLANTYHVHLHTIRSIVQHTRWKHLPDVTELTDADIPRLTLLGRVDLVETQEHLDQAVGTCAHIATSRNN